MRDFISRNKTAIIATVAAGTAAVGAYMYYAQLQQQHEKKPAKKTKKSKKSVTEEEKKKEEPPIYPIDANGEPVLGDVDLLNDKTKEEWAGALKEKGNALFKKKDFENAIKYYTFALSLKEDPVYYSNISACYSSLLNYEKVIEMATKALALRPDYSKVLVRRANAYEKLGNFGDAMFDLSVCSLNTDMSDASIEPILERNLNQQAMFVLNTKLGVTDKKSQLPSNTALTSFFGIFKPELSFANYDDTCEGDKELLNGLKNLYRCTAEGYETADLSFTKATEYFLKQLSETPDDETVKEKTAIALEHQGIFKFLKNNPLEAHEDIKKALELHPRINSYIYMALILADKGDTDNYFANYEKAMKLDDKNAALYYHRGQMYFITQQYEKAGEDFDKAKELDPENIFPYIQLACLSYRENKFDDCETLFSEARRKFPNSSEVPNFYAEILADKGDFDAALKEYERAIELEKKQDAVHVGIAPLVGKATLLVRTPTVENFVEATSLLEEAVKEDPRSEQAKISLGQLKLQQEDIDEAIELFESAATLARTFEEKLQATTFAEAAKIQKRIRADPKMSAKIQETIAALRASDFANL
nr:TOM70 [Naumovozyma castellii]